MFIDDGEFAVTIANEFCFIEDTIQLEILTLPSIDLGDDMVICEDSYATIVAQGGWSDFEWNDGSQGSSLLVFEEGIYTYTYESVCGLAGDSIEVTVMYCDTAIYIPNAFTPDGDGLNEYFQAEGIGISEFELRIYDRDGRLVYESLDISEKWNGSVRDGSYYAKDGIYVYRVRYSFDSSLPTVSAGISEKYGDM